MNTINYLKDALKVYEEFIKSHNQTTINSNLVNVNEDISELKIKSDIDEISVKLFILLSKSLISGEYINIVNYSTTISQFDKILEVELNKDCEYLVSIADLNNNLKIVLNYLKIFYKEIENAKINHVDNDAILTINASNNQIQKLNNLYLHQFLKFTLILSNLDNFLSSEKDNRTILLIIKQELEKLINVSETNSDLVNIYNILYDKCNFLIVKSFYDSDKDLKFQINYEKYNVSQINLKSKPIKSIYSKYSLLHFQNSINNNEELVNDIKKKLAIGTLDYNEYILLINLYCKGNVSINKGEELIHNFENKAEKSLCKQDSQNPLNKFNVISYTIVKQYLQNCLLSLKFLKKGYTFEKLKIDINYITENQIDTGIYNYYPFLKAIEYLEKDINNDIVMDYHRTLSENKVDIVTKIKEKIEFYKKLLDSFKKNVDWCKRNNFYPFQLPFKECCYEHGDYTVFIASSFARPIDYIKLEKYYNDFSYKYLIFHSSLNLVNEKLNILDIKENILKERRRTFEYFAAFIAIITFLFGSIQLFDKHNSFPETLITIISIGSVLCLFMALVLIIFEKKISKFLILIGIILSFIISLYFLYKELPENSNRQETVNISETTHI